MQDQHESEEFHSLSLYLCAPTPVQPLALVLAGAAFFTFAASTSTIAALLVLLILVMAIAVGAPRWCTIAVVFVFLVCIAWQLVMMEANGAHDSRSVRDEAVEVATAAWLAGDNPWRQTAPGGSPISTGPTSILLASPFIAAVGTVNGLSMGFYVVLGLILMWGDLQSRNDSFATLVLLIPNGVFGLVVSMYWGLDELFYGFVLLFLAWMLIRNDRFFLCGSCLALALGVRLSYLFPILGFLVWTYGGALKNPKQLARLSLGFAITCVCLISPFLFFGSTDLLNTNPFTTTGIPLALQQWPATNPVFRTLNWACRVSGPMGCASIKTLIVAGGIWVGHITARKSTHPFWHVTAGGFAANILVYRAMLHADYLPFFTVPALIGLAFSGVITEPFLRGRDPSPAP